MGPSESTKRLIVDLGMHHGDDTDFYLRKGFRVLAVEASPDLAARAQTVFRDQIATGDLVVLNLAVADHEGEIDFYLSDQDLWASTRPDMADRGFGGGGRKISVPCSTLDTILAPYETPYYVKIDVEGCDRVCVEALGRLDRVPPFVSFEADLPAPEETTVMLEALRGYGYRRFKLVNQAVHSTRTMPVPPLEGNYAEPRFTKHSSGPFGEESPGPWQTVEEVLDRYRATVKQQAARIEYSARGTVFGVPMARLHKPLMSLYNAAPVTRARRAYADLRGVEVGGWFDIHAAL